MPWHRGQYLDRLDALAASRADASGRVRRRRRWRQDQIVAAVIIAFLLGLCVGLKFGWDRGVDAGDGKECVCLAMRT